jgi:enterochelin esterase-like enzyme
MGDKASYMFAEPSRSVGIFASCILPLTLVFAGVTACAEPQATEAVVSQTTPALGETIFSASPTTVAATATTVATSPSPTSSPEIPTITASPVPTLSSTPTYQPTASPSATSIPPSPTAACDENQGRMESGVYFSGIIGQDQPYRVYLPPCYAFLDERFPVLYMLHGYPFDDSHWDELGIDEAADAAIAGGALPSFIIAMPSADNEGTYTKTSGGAASFEAVIMDEFIPFIEANYRTLGTADGRAIGGMSRGGVWALEIAFRNPGQFSAVGGHSAALNVNLAPPLYDPLFLAADPAVRTLRIYLDVGKSDWVMPGMEDLHAALLESDVPHEYNIFVGTHEDRYWAEHVADYLAFYAAAW